MNKEIKTYKTEHPTIKEISIGDKFVLNNGNIVTFVEYDKTIYHGYDETPFRLGDYWYCSSLLFGGYKENKDFHPLNANIKFLSFQDKLNLI